jgi:hypothetical protein
MISSVLILTSSQYKPLLKFLSIKLVIFLTFYQQCTISHPSMSEL